MSWRAEGLGSHLFSFALLADTHCNDVDGRSTSPYTANQHANARTRNAIRCINREDVEFTIHLGDIVNPLPGSPGYQPACAAFTTIAGELRRPLHLVPGNHDVGDKVLDWSPAPPVTEAGLSGYRQFLAPEHFTTFDHGDCHFVILNAQLLGSGLADEERQRRWFEADLDQHAGKRIFVSLHYPPFLDHAEESATYDNLNPVPRRWLLDLLERHRVEALFAGHVHVFFYHRHASTDCYVLPSTTFVRHDYTHLFPGPPAPEWGRDDVGKLGYALIHVHERGHIFEGVDQGIVTGKAPTRLRQLPVRRETRHAVPLGVDLRRAWGSPFELPASGAVDEFARKRVRNDYNVLRLWDLGLQHLRVPISDLLNPEVRKRMTLLVAKGHRFTIAGYGVPDDQVLAQIHQHRHLIDAWEIVFAQDDVELVGRLAGLRRDLGRPLIAAPLHGTHHAGSGHFHHAVRFGVSPDGLAEAANSPWRKAFDAVLTVIEMDRRPWSAFAAAQACGMPVRTLLRFAGISLAKNVEDDQALALRTAEACLASWRFGLTTFFDTWIDNDRGHFVRHGLLDGAYNPRPAGVVLRNLATVLARIDPARDIDVHIDGSAGAPRNKRDRIVLTPTRGAVDDGEAMVSLLDGGLCAKDHDAGGPFLIMPGHLFGALNSSRE